MQAVCGMALKYSRTSSQYEIKREMVT